MKVVVQKYGGSSVADNQKLFNVCKHIIRGKRKRQLSSCSCFSSRRYDRRIVKRKRRNLL